MHKVKTYNQISVKGLDRFPRQSYEVGSDMTRPDAYLLRSHKLHGEPVPESLLAVARAGAGVNNVPVAAYGNLGIVVFNTPGANANAVKELVMAGMLLATRGILPGIDYVQSLTHMTDAAEMAQLLEKEKARFAGGELKGKTLGIVGLGAIGSMVRSDYISLHVPAMDATRHMINADALAGIKPGAVLLNFARETIVDSAAVLRSLDAGKLGRYVCDFPEPAMLGHAKVIATPHIGASTEESEENCAVMAADQLIDYLEHGNITNSVNLPQVSMGRTPGTTRITFSNDNVSGVLGHVLSVLADHQVNVIDMVNKSRGELAYNIIDVETPPAQAVITAMQAIGHVIRVRVI